MAGDITPFPAPADLLWAITGGAVRRERTAGGVMAILPELRPTLVVMLGDPHWLRAAAPGASWAEVPDAALWGPALHARRGWTAGDVRAIGFGLTPAGVRALCGAPPGRLLDRTIGLGAAGDRFADACRQAWRGDRVDVDAVIAAVRALVGAGAPLSPRPTLCVDPDTPIADQARAAGLSERQFRRRFAAEWGVSPKLWQRLARVDAMLAALHPRSWEPAPAADPAVRFADEPHLIREFRRLTGFTPRAYRMAAAASGTPTLRSLPIAGEAPPPAPAPAPA
jgi:AraC-like DNA-binding protein